MAKYSESAVKLFYNQEDKKYQSFWSNDGSLHWGYFSDYPNEAQFCLPDIDDTFVKACKKWDAIMLEKSGINRLSRVLDLGCGNGAVSMWLAEQTGAQIIGVDLSDLRIANGQQKLAENPTPNVRFQIGSATQLEFENGYFTHVWSQAALCHVPELNDAVKEISRVLAPHGVLIMDDLVRPQRVVDIDAEKYVYDRLLIGQTFSHEDYLKCMPAVGLSLVEDIDLSAELQQSYRLLSVRAKDYPENSFAYIKMCEAIEKKQLGWSFFKALKENA